MANQVSPFLRRGLQWGRGFSAAERENDPPLPLPDFYTAASMGPRLLIRGEKANKKAAEEAAKASMGPRLLSRGEAYAAASAPRRDRLQWGRGFSAAERNNAHAAALAAVSGFNGAAASQPRRVEAMNDRDNATVGFNGAAASQPRREYLRNSNKRKGLNRLLRAARSTFLLNAVVSPMQDS